MNMRPWMAAMSAFAATTLAPTAFAAPYECGQGPYRDSDAGTCSGPPPEPFSRSGANIIFESDSLHADVIISQNPAGGCTGSHAFRPEYGGCTIPSTETESESRVCNYTMGGVNYMNGNQARTRTRTRYAHQNGSTLYSHWSAWGEYSACVDGMPEAPAIEMSNVSCTIGGSHYTADLADPSTVRYSNPAITDITVSTSVMFRSSPQVARAQGEPVMRSIMRDPGCTQSFVVMYTLNGIEDCAWDRFSRQVRVENDATITSYMIIPIGAGGMMMGSFSVLESAVTPLTGWQHRGYDTYDCYVGPPPDPDPNPGGGGGGNPVVGQTLTLTGNLICNSSHTYYGYGPYGTPMALVGSAGRNAIINAYKSLPSQRCPEFGDPPDWTSAYGYWIDQMGRRMAGLVEGEPQMDEGRAITWVTAAIPNGAGHETLQNSHDGCQALADQTFGAGKATARFITKGESGYTGDSCRVTNIH